MQMKAFKNKKICFLFCSLWLVLLVLSPVMVQAKTTSAKGAVWIQDDAGLLTTEEEALLEKTMEDMSPYGNVVFYAIDVNSYSAKACAQQMYQSLYGITDGTLLLIDMDNREIYIYNSGEVSECITNQESYSITDNVYQYATDEDYFTCAKMVYEQELALMEGRQIPRPMKYISNFLLAAVLAVLLNYMIVRRFSRTRNPKDQELLAGLKYHEAYGGVCAEYTHETKRYDPVSSGSSGGSSSGGGHSGGGSSSGGGHRF